QASLPQFPFPAPNDTVPNGALVDDNQVNNVSDSDTATVGQQPDLVTVNCPGAPNLNITKTGPASFTAGQAGAYTLHVANGPAPAIATTGTITVTDPLPAGFTFTSASGAGWTCGSNGQTVTCSHPGPVAPGTALPNITVN